MLRKTPVKNEIYKTEIYLKHKKLIYKLAFDSLNAVQLDLDDLIYEFNVIFCKAIQKYHPSKGCFSTFLYKCCKSHLYNIIRIQQEPKRNGNIINDTDYLDTQGINTEDKIILFDNFVKSKNPVIQCITGIISTYKLPDEKFRIWLKSILRTYGFKHKDIKKAFKILRKLY